MNYTKAFFKYVTQNVCGMIGVSVYLLADTFFISVAGGTDGITVLNLALPIYGLIFALGAMIGAGSATYYALRRAMGERDIEGCFYQAVCRCILISIPITLAGIFVPDKIMIAMGADAGILEMAAAYTGTFMAFTPFFIMNNTFTSFARNDGDPTVAMLSSISGSAFNILFDYIFMFPMGMGVRGAALATGLSPIVSILVSLLHYFGKKNHIRLVIVRPSLKQFMQCCSLGVSAFIGEISSGITTMVFNFLLLKLVGNIAVAAYGVTANLALVCMAIFNGISQGVQPLLSDCFGRGDVKNLRHVRRLCLAAAAGAELLLIAVAYGGTDTLIGIFNSEKNPLLVVYAHTGMRLYFLGYLAAGINIMLISYFAAIGRAGIAFTASLLRGVAAISVCALLMSRLFGINGIWLSFLASETITLLVMAAAVMWSRKKAGRKEKG